MGRKDWNTYGVCPGCGFTAKAPLGDMWFLEKEMVICPDCGISVKKWEKKVGRRVIVEKGKYFWTRNTWGWEWKDE